MKSVDMSFMKGKQTGEMLLTILLWGFLVMGCANGVDTPKLDKLELKLTDNFFLPLDSVTTSNNLFYQVLETDSSTYLTFLNPLVNALYTYDLKRRSIVRVLPIAKEGPNGLGHRVTSFQIISADSILFHSYYRRSLYLTNGQGVVQKTYPLHGDTLEYYPESRAGAGFIRYGSKVFINSGMGCSTTTPELFKTQLIIGLHDSLFNEFLPLPISYKTKRNTFWPKKYCQLYSSFDPDSKRIIYGFAGDENLYFYNMEDDIVQVPMGTGYLGNQKAIPLSRFPGDPMGEFKAFLTYNRFGRVHFDPYRNLILRTFYYRTSDELLAENILRSRASLIVANKQMEILGEAELKGSDEIFFTREGMHQVLFNSGREDSLEIQVYEVVF